LDLARDRLASDRPAQTTPLVGDVSANLAEHARMITKRAAQALL
jgi:hypothetical protein